MLSLSLIAKLKLIKEHCTAKIAENRGVSAISNCSTSVPDTKNVHRSMQPELILHRVNTGNFNSIDLMFRLHICSFHFTDTSRRIQESRKAKKISKLYV